MPIGVTCGMGWLRKHAKALIWAVLGMLGIGAVLSLRRRKNALLRSEADAVVIEARSKVLALRETRAALAEDSVVRADEIASIDRAIDSHKSRIASVQTQHGLTAEEIAAEFSKLGY